MEFQLQFRKLLYKWTGFVASLVGHDIFASKLIITPYLILTTVIGLLFPFLYGWTVFKYDGDLRLSAISYYGTALQVATKTIFPILHRQHIQKSTKFLTEVYQANINAYQNHHLFKAFLQTLTLILKLMLCCAVYGFCLFIFSPELLYLIDDSHLEPIIPWVLPGTGPGSSNKRDYLINTAYNCFAMFCSTNVFIIFEFMFTFLLLHVSLLTNVMRNSFEPVDCLLEKRFPLRSEIRVRLRNIVLMHNELSGYIAGLKEIYFYPLAICIFCSTASLAFRIFAVLVMEHVPFSMYFLMMWDFFELGFVCGVCSVIDICNDQFYDDLKTSNWHLLPTEFRRPFIILLDRAKKPNNFKAADLLPLNMNTYVLLNNRIYSFAMVLRRILLN